MTKGNTNQHTVSILYVLIDLFVVSTEGTEYGYQDELYIRGQIEEGYSIRILLFESNCGGVDYKFLLFMLGKKIQGKVRRRNG